MKTLIAVLLLTSGLHQVLAAFGCVAANEYIGRVSWTTSGKDCQAWSAQSPQTHTYTANSRFPDGSVAAAANNCRDPGNDGYTWCYTTDRLVRWERCSVKQCGELFCTSSNKYKGNLNVTISGRECQAWSVQSPHPHTEGTADSQFPEGSVAGAKNYCRDPDNTGSLWCYTTDLLVPREKCRAALCFVF